MKINFWYSLSIILAVGVTSYFLRAFPFIVYGTPEFLAVIMVVVLHVWKRQTLMSILGGTVFYMILLQKVFV